VTRVRGNEERQGVEKVRVEDEDREAEEKLKESRKDDGEEMTVG